MLDELRKDDGSKILQMRVQLGSGSTWTGRSEKVGEIGPRKSLTYIMLSQKKGDVCQVLSVLGIRLHFQGLRSSR